jgi:hypothetical protein
LINTQFFAAQSVTHNLQSLQVDKEEKLDDDLLFSYGEQNQLNNENLAQ